MAEVCMAATINASPDDVWRVVSDFGGIDNILDVVQSVTIEGSGVGALRTLTMQDGAHVVERLDSQDDQARTLSYSIVSSPLPIEDYAATMSVREISTHECELTWSSTFRASGTTEAAAKELVEGIYAAGFAGLKKLLGG